MIIAAISDVFAVPICDRTSLSNCFENSELENRREQFGYYIKAFPNSATKTAKKVTSPVKIVATI